MFNVLTRRRNCSKLKLFSITASNVPWNEEFLIYISKPELAMVRFVLKDCDRSHERAGQNTLPFSSITQGEKEVFKSGQKSGVQIIVKYV